MVYGTTPAIDHNGYVKDNKYYLANYAAGLRVIDISNIADQEMEEVGYFDTYTADNNASYNGVWNVYPYFPSGNVMITDRSGGFFLVRSNTLGLIDNEVSDITVYPNPANSEVVVQTRNTPITTISLHDISGKLIFTNKYDALNQIIVSLDSIKIGMYFLTINNTTTRRITRK